MLATQTDMDMYNIGYHIVGKFGGGKFGELTLLEHLAKESSAN